MGVTPYELEGFAALLAGAAIPIAVGLGAHGPIVPTALAVAVAGVSLHGHGLTLRGDSPAMRLAHGALAGAVFGAVYNIQRAASSNAGRVAPSDLIRGTNPEPV
jgi:hypothetical protein